MSYVVYNAEKLRKIVTEVFEKMGYSQNDAKTIADVLILADLYGIESHGVQRLSRYYNGIKKNTIHIDAKPEIVFETPVSAVIDGHSGMGQVIANFANNLAIKKAKEVGMAFVTVRNSNHYGIAGYYTKVACDAGMIGICTTNTESIAVHTNSRQALLGSNPIAFAMPAEPYPFWFDAATTVVPRGKLEVYNKADKPLDYGWATGEDGNVSTDASHVLHCINDKVGSGGILPVGGNSESSGSHKGYGFSMMCELLCSIVSGGATSNHHVRRENEGAQTCHSFIVINPEIFGNAEEQKAALSVFLEELRSAKRADENTPIYTHGEKEFLRYHENCKNGISVHRKTADEITDICNSLGISALN